MPLKTLSMKQLLQLASLSTTVVWEVWRRPLSCHVQICRVTETNQILPVRLEWPSHQQVHADTCRHCS